MLIGAKHMFSLALKIRGLPATGLTCNKLFPSQCATSSLLLCQLQNLPDGLCDVNVAPGISSEF